MTYYIFGVRVPSKRAVSRFFTFGAYTLIAGVAFINAGQTEMFYLTHQL